MGWGSLFPARLEKRRQGSQSKKDPLGPGLESTLVGHVHADLPVGLANLFDFSTVGLHKHLRCMTLPDSTAPVSICFMSALRSLCHLTLLEACEPDTLAQTPAMFAPLLVVLQLAAAQVYQWEEVSSSGQEQVGDVKAHRR